jgi:Type IV secretion system pilin
MTEIIPNPLRIDSLMELLSVILGVLIYLGTIALVLAFAWTGFQFVMAQGAPEKISDARRSLMWTVIGGVILLGAEAIALIIEATAMRI